MKKILLTLIVFSTTLNVDAQFKKTSFLKKKGRAFELGAGMQFYEKTKGSSPTVAISWGKENGKTNIFHWWDLEVVLPNQFSYSTSERVNGIGGTLRPVQVSGKAAGLFSFRYNWAYFFRNNRNEDVEYKFMPFTKIALTIANDLANESDVTIASIVSSSTNSTNMLNNSLIQDIEPKYMIGADFGIGAVYKYSKTSSIKFCTGYRLSSPNKNSAGSFYPVSNHLFVNVGIRYLMLGEQ
jgi:hypothetical protein